MRRTLGECVPKGICTLTTLTSRRRSKIVGPFPRSAREDTGAFSGLDYLVAIVCTTRAGETSPAYIPLFLSPYAYQGSFAGALYQSDELEPFIASLADVPKSGLHNPLKNPERYLLYGQVLQKTAAMLHDERVFDFFTKCIMRTFPKSYQQVSHPPLSPTLLST